MRLIIFILTLATYAIAQTSLVGNCYRMLVDIEKPTTVMLKITKEDDELYELLIISDSTTVVVPRPHVILSIIQSKMIADVCPE